MDFANQTEADLRQGQEGSKKNLNYMSYRKETSSEPWCEEKEEKSAVSRSLWAGTYLWAKENEVYRSRHSLD